MKPDRTAYPAPTAADLIAFADSYGTIYARKPRGTKRDFVMMGASLPQSLEYIRKGREMLVEWHDYDSGKRFTIHTPKPRPKANKVDERNDYKGTLHTAREAFYMGASISAVVRNRINFQHICNTESRSASIY